MIIPRIVLRNRIDYGAMHEFGGSNLQLTVTVNDTQNPTLCA